MTHMKIVALYKTFDGGEFVDASLASIYDHVAAIVMVHSDTSWLGEKGNTVKRLALDWCQKNDIHHKVHHVDVSTDSQERQYASGIDAIRKLKIREDVVMAIDADEVWEDQYIINAVRFMSDNIKPAYRSNMHTYLKSPFFRVSPPYGSPGVFFRKPAYLSSFPRGCGAPSFHMPDVWMHHYTYVRESRDLVAKKIKQSCKADKTGDIIVPGWMESIYDNLPEGRDLHAFEKWKQVWHSVEKVWTCDLPPAMRKARLLPLWMPEGHLLDGEMNAIHRLSFGRNQAVDLGTYKGRSAAVLSLACRKVHSVDCYRDIRDSFADTLKPDRYQDMQDHSFEENKKLAARLGNLTVENSRSSDAAENWKGDPVDVLFVDDDHSEKGVFSAVDSWLPKMNLGGIVIFHDDNDIHPGVQNAIMRLKSDARFRFFSPGEWSGSVAVCEVVSK